MQHPVGVTLGQPVGDGHPQPQPQLHVAPRPLATRRTTPKPLITRTHSSYLDNPPSPPPKLPPPAPAKQQPQAIITTSTAIREEDHVATTTTSTTPVKPATAVADHPNDSTPSTTQQENVLPTARSIHPDVQAEALQHEDPEVVAAQLEKAEGDRRHLRGEEPKGKIVEGIEDDQLFALLRRFDADVTHTLLLTSIAPLPPTQPDLRRSALPDVPYSTDILKSNVERLYASSGVGVIRAANELMRLRSWSEEERKRTLYFCATYFLAWALGLAIPTVLGFILVLVVSPESRFIFFPPIPPPKGTPVSAFDPTNKAGDQTLLGGSDSAVAHKSKAEQKEEAAWEFRCLAETFAVKLAMSSAKPGSEGNAQVGQKVVHNSDSDDDDEERTEVDTDEDFLDTREEPMADSSLYAPGEHPTELTRQNKASRGHHRDSSSSQPQGMTGKTKKIKTKSGETVERPMTEKERKKTEAKEAKTKRDAIVGKYLKLTQDGLGDFADLSEIMTNALSPPRPYPPSINLARYKLAGAILLPLLLATAFVPSWVWTRGASFLFGFLFFGQPVLDKGLEVFIAKVPNWQEYLDMRNSLLWGVPTNDQLVLHLLRVGEREGRPLPRPPPPPLAGTPKEQIKDNAPDPDDDLVDSDGNSISVSDLGTKDKAMHKTKSKMVSGLKSLSKRVAGIGADVTVDGVKKKVGGRVDRLIWGGMLKDEGDPESYPCKLNGKNGHLTLDPMSEYGVPTITFATASIDSKHEFHRDINDIVELKKLGISVPRAVLGWASGADIESQTLVVRMKDGNQRAVSRLDGSRESTSKSKSKGGKGAGESRANGFLDGVGDEDEEGETYEFQAVGRREQLFTRLLSLGEQRWESL